VPLGSTTFWAAILPVEKTNLVLRPSAERDAIGVASINSATIGTSSQYQQFGAWSYAITPDANTNSGASFGTYSSGNGTSYTLSAYVRAAAGVPMRLYVAASNSLDSGLGSVEFTGGGTWQRYSVSYTENSSTNRRAGVVKRSSADTNIYYVDGLQAEVGSLTTYLDGEQEGCYWQGVPHASPSTRSGTYRGGGSVIALADLGLKPDEHLGIGMPPQEITALSYALLPGAEYQRSRAGERAFTLTFEPILGTTTQDYHITRRRIINAIKPDLVDPQQPVRFWYTGGQGTVQIDAVYQSGLELGEMDGPMAENGAVTFVAHDPYWYATTQEGTSLAPRMALGSVNAIARRDPLGRWGTMGAHGTSVAGTVDTLLMAPTGTLFVGGRVNTFDGTANSRGLAMYYPSTNRFGSMGGTFTPGAVRNVTSLSWSPWGSLYIGGQFTAMSGTATRYMALWNGGFGSLLGGTVDERPLDLQLSATGTLFAAGAFFTANGTTAPRLAMWMPAGSWGTLAGQGAGTIDNVVTDIVFGYDQRLYFTGIFGSAGGTAMNAIGQWRSGTFGTMGSGLQWSIGGVEGDGLAVGADGILTIGGIFGTAGGVPGTHVAQWNGISYTIPGGGLGTTQSNQVTRLAVQPSTGNIYATGIFSYNSKNIPFPDGMAIYNGYTWLPLDIDTAIKVSSGGVVNAIAFGPDNSLYVGGQWSGTAHAAAVAEIVNDGMGEAYPTFKALNTGAGTARIYQLVNTLTGDGLYFNYSMLPGEELTLITRPGERTFTSSFFGNVFNSFLPGSNIASFRLLSGTNYISLYCDSSNVTTSFYWQSRHDSIDGGTIA
jgi:hypothetical protein